MWTNPGRLRSARAKHSKICATRPRVIVVNIGLAFCRADICNELISATAHGPNKSRIDDCVAQDIAQNVDSPMDRAIANPGPVPDFCVQFFSTDQS